MKAPLRILVMAAACVSMVLGTASTASAATARDYWDPVPVGHYDTLRACDLAGLDGVFRQYWLDWYCYYNVDMYTLYVKRR